MSCWQCVRVISGLAIATSYLNVLRLNFPFDLSEKSNESERENWLA